MPASSPYPRRFAPGDLEGVQPAHDTELFNREPRRRNTSNGALLA
jgi:hypothetical protein